jgi:AcrR family transcriptional regulator
MKKGSKAAEPDTNGIPSDTPQPDARRSDARRKYDPEQTKRNILDVATQEFSAMGLTGARVDAIAERTNTTKRMLYYYFGSKEGLYSAVLEKVYGDIRALEQDLHVSELDPVEGMRALVEFTFDYHDRQRDFVRLVTIENIHGAKYVEQVKTFKGRNVTVIHTIEDLLAVLSPRRQSPYVRYGVWARSVASAFARKASRDDCGCGVAVCAQGWLRRVWGFGGRRHGWDWGLTSFSLVMGWCAGEDG